MVIAQFCVVLLISVGSHESPHLVSSDVFVFHFLIRVASLKFELEKRTCFDAESNFTLKFKQNPRKCMITHLWANQHQVDQTGLALVP